MRQPPIETFPITQILTLQETPQQASSYRLSTKNNLFAGAKHGFLSRQLSLRPIKSSPRQKKRKPIQ